MQKLIKVTLSQPKEPIPPETIFSIGLQAKKNPSYPGVYQFRIKALPAGENPVALDLGVVHLSFYSTW